MEPTLHPHHPMRYILILVFIAVLLLTAGKAGQDFTYHPPVPKQVQLDQVAEAAVVSEPIAPIPAGPDEAQAQTQTVTPSPVRGVYLTAWSAGNPKTIQRIEEMAASTEINTVVIDIKDATGKLSYEPTDPDLLASGVGTKRISDLSALTADLHAHGIYVVGRMQVFQDSYYAPRHTEDAFIDTRTNGPWRDYKGIMWLRADAVPVWNYVVAIAKDAHAHGVDEINVDYVRFPSDGELQFLNNRGTARQRVETLESFFTYLGDALHADGIVLSADIFGLTMSATDDLGIGQKLEAIAPHVDYVCPMVYPSHFAAGAYGIGLPAEHPYEIIHTSLTHGINKLAAINIGPEKLRPWLQDFNLGAIYTSAMVRTQITATEELGITSWLLWDPRNIYTSSALQSETAQLPNF